MEMQIGEEMLKGFSDQYNLDKNNKIMENIIANIGVKNVLMNNSVKNAAIDTFNIDLGKVLITDQKNSLRCWIFAGLNMFKRYIANNLNINATEFELSQNYLGFYNRLEVANNTYETIIKLANRELSDRELHHMISIYTIPEGGHWSMFVALVNKYGIVPKEVMPETIDSQDPDEMNRILNEKVKKDIFILRNMLESGEGIDKIRETKISMLQQLYSILSKILGEPPKKFNYEYKDKEGVCNIIKDITPIQFRDKYLDKNLDDYVSLGNVPMYNKEYYKMYKEKFFGNIHENSNMVFLNLPIEDVKNLCLKQLKDREPIWFASEIVKMRDKGNGIFDSNLYDYEGIFGIKKMSKEENLNSSDIILNHAMVFAGVNIEDEKPTRWKVEDSLGSEIHKNGYYVMNDNFFDDFVLQVIINKKHLSQEQLDLLNQDSILFDMWDPMG
ncbi:MAG TPA: aminopeptidase [Clostridiales bacterium]|nr:MAG: hypothetical protein A2Y18_01055 [Clostridiales bacterium GWD2_32_19]HCC06625.1 aminopeptidase [Clostridiales bacterium]